AVALAARAYLNSEGLSSDPAPWKLWVWTAVFAASVAVAVLGFTGARWWRRGLSLAAVPLTFVCALLVVNNWTGYYPTLRRAWAAVGAGPPPAQTARASRAALRNPGPDPGRVFPVAVPSAGGGFRPRREYVYLPPAWFAGDPPPRLPVLMMITGEFGNPTNW